MNILVTGSGTLVGNTISIKLSKKYNILALYNKSKPINLIKYKNIKILKADITKKIVIKKNFDAFIHCASLVPGPTTKKNLINKVNYLGFKKLLNIAKKKIAKKLFYYQPCLFTEK